MATIVSIEVLGPVRAMRDGAEVDLGRVGQRAVLGLLALAGGQPLSRAELIDALWGASPPPTAANVLQTSVKNLRQGLEPDRKPRMPSTVLPSVGDGYALRIPAEHLDLSRFRQLVARAARHTREGDQRAAVRVLAGALALWRGQPLADITALAAHPKLVPLAEERHAAQAGYAEALIAAGSAAEAVPILEAAAAEQPLDEAAHARLILGYQAAGRRGKAFAAYQTIQRRLVDELGVDPGRELVRAHAALLASEASMRGTTWGPVPGRTEGNHPVPAQLPAATSAFTGRSEQLRLLSGLLGDPAGEARVIVLSGTAGVGKTTLALHFAHQIQQRFPDGQLYVNLRGFHPGDTVMDPARAVRGFLDAFGVPAERMPADLDDRTALYRSVLVDRRVLIVLDNARDAEQVRPLLPGADGCLVLVTSRDRLTSLVATDGAYPVTVDVPSAAEARALLARRLGAPRTAAAPDAVDELIGLCSRLPLALAIVAARAATEPAFPLDLLARQLREEGWNLDALAGDDPATDVRAVFSWSYRTLTEPAARLFRLLGLHPGPEVTVQTAAALAGRPVGEVRGLLRELSRTHLVIETQPGRYAGHDLLRRYASELTTTHDRADERRDALRRVLDHWATTAHAADRLLDPHREPIPPLATGPGVPVTVLADRAAAMDWMAAESGCLLAAVDLAGAQGFDGHTWRLAWALTTYLHRSGHWDVFTATQVVALGAAERVGDRPARADAHRGLARAYLQAERPGAVGHLRTALRLYRELDDAAGQARTQMNLAWIAQRHSRLYAALGHAERAVRLFRAAGQPVGEADAHNAVGWLHAHLGRLDEALHHCEHALRLSQETGDEDGEAHIWDSLGYVNGLRGSPAEALRCYRRAAELRRDLGDRFYEAEALRHIGDILAATGDPAAARSAWQEALDRFGDFRPPAAEEIRAKLALSGRA